jgi:hypothetical protein
VDFWYDLRDFVMKTGWATMPAALGLHRRRDHFGACHDVAVRRLRAEARSRKGAHSPLRGEIGDWTGRRFFGIPSH